MAEPAKDRAPRPEVEAVPDPEPEEVATVSDADAQAHAEDHGAGTCPVAWCPICIAATAVQPLRPEVVEHLLKAGTELLLAFRGVIDARADSYAEEEPAAPTRFEKIDLG
jgi:hypothetical protein